MILLGIHQQSVQVRGQVSRSPLLLLFSGSFCPLSLSSGWPSRAGGHYSFSGAGRARQPVPWRMLTPHIAATIPALWWTQLGKWKEGKVRAAIHVGERDFGSPQRPNICYCRIPSRDAQSKLKHENTIMKTQDEGHPTKHGLCFFSKKKKISVMKDKESWEKSSRW